MRKYFNLVLVLLFCLFGLYFFVKVDISQALGPPVGYAESTIVATSCGPSGISFKFDLVTTEILSQSAGSNNIFWYSDYQGDENNPVIDPLTVVSGGRGGTRTLGVNASNYSDGDTVTVTPALVQWESTISGDHTCLFDPAFLGDPGIHYCGQDLIGTCTYSDPAQNQCTPNTESCQFNTDCCSNYCDQVWGYCTDVPSAPPPPPPQGPPAVNPDPVPDPYVPCDDTESPEFHSLRPYQASPCDTTLSNQSLMCGNEIQVIDAFSVSPINASLCLPIGNGNWRCQFDVDRNFTITVDAGDATLPIAGNTEEVVNSQNENEPLLDADKLSNYVSWYVNGTAGKAEYPPVDDSDLAATQKLVDYAGVAKKILSWDQQTRVRIDQIDAAKDERHDQVIGCVNLIGRVTECYPQRAGVKEIRLSDWDGHLPPLPEDYDDPKDFWIAYKEWRGESCVSIIGINVCVNLPIRADHFGNLFSYIPLSSTEDKEGTLVAHDAATVVALDMSVNNLQTSWQNKPRDERNQTTANNEAVLYFPHMLENKESVSQLQNTYLPKELIANQTAGPTTAPKIGPFCKVLQVRSNTGDRLFGEEIVGEVSYTTEFDCTFGSNILGLPTGSCSRAATFSSKVDTNTPDVDDLWIKSVAGNASIFKRLVPKIGGGAIDEIVDLPAVSGVAYSSTATLLSGSSEIYFPHLGGVQEYFLNCIQTILRPQGYGPGCLGSGSGQTTPPPGGGQCSYTQSQIDSAINAAASKYGVPASLLQAIFEIEGLDWIANPSGYVCQENFASAAGLMQITQGAYNVVTCEDERLANDIGVCSSPGNTLSRCDVNDEFELAARVLLWKAGQWYYGPGNCSQAGPFPTDKQSIYNAACNYYGSFSPDNLTINLSQSIPESERRPDGPMNYCDIVCYKMGLCPPYP